MSYPSEMPRPIRAVIKASALRHNLKLARETAGEAKIWAVLKANAYGHGLERAARALADADGFALLDFQEAARLRLAGVTKPILMLEGFFKPLDMNLILKYDLTPVIHNADQVELIQHMDLPYPLDLYLKVNSGMNRLGFGVDTLRPAYNTLRMHRGVGNITLMTHFADADARQWRARPAALVQRAGAAVRGGALAGQFGGAAALQGNAAKAGCAPASCSTAARRSPIGAPRRSACSRR